MLIRTTLAKPISIIVLFGLLTSSAVGQSPRNYIHIKFDASFVERLEGAPKDYTSDGIVQLGLAELDSLSRLIGVRYIERLIPYSPKYEQRHRAHGLHLWYRFEVDRYYAPHYMPMQYADMFRACEVITESEQPLPTSIIDGYSSSSVSPRQVSINAGADTDPLFDQQWHYNNTGQTGGAVDADIDLLEAWELSRGSEDVVVAVLDQGIDFDHEDLAKNIWRNMAEINGQEGVDDDGNGYVDDFHGYGFYDDGAVQPGTHGTHVAGVIAAVSENGLGVAGIAGGEGAVPGVSLMSCMIFGPGDDSGAAGIEAAFVYAADNGAVIAQNSWGYDQPYQFSQSLLDAIDYFVANAGYDENGNIDGPVQGGIVVFSAGNSASSEPYYPAAYPSVIAVASTDDEDRKSGFSNYSTAVDISAPGSAVLSTVLDDEYDFLSGTSMAAPHVSGVAGLVISDFSGTNLTAPEVWSRLLVSADEIDSLNESYAGELGAGRLNAHQALATADLLPPVLDDTFRVVFAEHGGHNVYDVNATSGLSETADEEMSYHIGGDDAGSFQVESSTGLLSFLSLPDFEDPDDLDADNTYKLSVIASNQFTSKSQQVIIEVSDVEESITYSNPSTIDQAVFESDFEFADLLGLTFSFDGWNLFVVAGSEVQQYELIAPFDLNEGYTLEASFDEYEGSEAYLDLAFGPDGRRFFVLLDDDGEGRLLQYTLEEPYDLTGESAYDGQWQLSFSPKGLRVSPDGLRFYFITEDGYVAQYTTEVAYDIQGGLVTEGVSSLQVEGMVDLEFSINGHQLYLVSEGGRIGQYALGLPFDVLSSISEVNALVLPDTLGALSAIAIDPSISKIHLGTGGGRVIQFSLPFLGFTEHSENRGGVDGSVQLGVRGTEFVEANEWGDSFVTANLGSGLSPLFVLQGGNKARLTFMGEADLHGEEDSIDSLIFSLSSSAFNPNSADVVGSQDLETPIPVTFRDGPSFPILEDRITIYENSEEPLLSLANELQLQGHSTSNLIYEKTGGQDSSQFTLDSFEGVLSWRQAVDYETPVDANGDNLHEIELKVSSDLGYASKLITIEVLNINEPPALLMEDSVSIVENQTLSFSAEGVDPDAGNVLVYTLSGEDAFFFSIDNTGSIDTQEGLDFEQPLDHDQDNVYELEVRVSDGELSASAQLLVSVLNANDNAPYFVDLLRESTHGEGTAALFELEATDLDGGSTLTMDLSGGVDMEAFSLIHSQLSFQQVPDFESPADASRDNVYEVEVELFDGLHRTRETLFITITNVNEQPIVTDTTFIWTTTSPVGVELGVLAAMDPDGDQLSYTLAFSEFAENFEVTGLGQLILTATSGFEDEQFPMVVLPVEVSDGQLSASMDVTILRDGTFPRPLSIDPGHGSDLLLFPNPSTDRVWVSLPSDWINWELQVFDIRGVVVEVSHSFIDGLLVFDLSQIPAGVYTLKVRHPLGSVSQVFLKN